MGLLGVPYCSTLPKIFRCLCALWGVCLWGGTKNLQDFVTFSRSDECHSVFDKQMFGENLTNNGAALCLNATKWLI